MQKHIGYTSEQFAITEDRIYKYTNDPARISFLNEQMNHLKLIGLRNPLVVPQNIKWEETENAWGYSMEYIHNAERITDKNLPEVFNLITLCSRLGDKNDIPSFNTYIDYLKGVITKNSELFQNNDYKLLNKYESTLISCIAEFDNYKSTSHGDFTMENILVSGDRLVIIDPIYKDGMWSSWLQDIAKFYQNIYFSDIQKTLKFSQLVPDESNSVFKLVHLLMIANYIRMFPYIKVKPLIYNQRYSEFQILLNSL